MIRIFVGEDTTHARKEARMLFEQARTEDPSSAASYFDDLLFDPVIAAEQLSAESLFGGQNILYFDGILGNPEGESFYRTTLKETGNLVIIREVAPPKDLLVFFERIGTVKDHPLAKKGEKPVTAFALADAMGARDKKNAWVEFEKLRRADSVMEEVHGTVFWAFKSIYLVATLSKADALATGMKDFTYRNYLSFSKHYTVPELRGRLDEIKEIYHRAHHGEGELSVLLERFILTL